MRKPYTFMEKEQNTVKIYLSKLQCRILLGKIYYHMVILSKTNTHTIQMCQLHNIYAKYKTTDSTQLN